MKKLVYIVAFLLALPVFGQSGINTATPNADADLDLGSTDKGLLLNRVALTATANAAPLSAHVAGMVVYNTATAGDVTPGYYYNDGTVWVRLADANVNNETITILVDNSDGTYTYTSEDGTMTTFDITQTGTGDPNGNGTTGSAGDIYVDESTGDIWVFDGTTWVQQTGGGTQSVVTQTVTTGNELATHDDGLGNITPILETVTTLVDNENGTFTHTAEDGNTQSFDATQTGTGDPNGNFTNGVAGGVYVDETTGEVWTFDGTNWVQQTGEAAAAANEPWFGTDDNAGATDNTEDIYHFGNMGLGTTSPTDRLHIESNGTADGSIFIDNTNTGSGFAQLLKLRGASNFTGVNLENTKTAGAVILDFAQTDAGTASLGLYGTSDAFILGSNSAASQGNLIYSPRQTVISTSGTVGDRENFIVGSNNDGTGEVVIGGVDDAGVSSTDVLQVSNHYNTANDIMSLYNDATEVLTVKNDGELQFFNYPNTRDDSGATTPSNILYTDAGGNILSSPTTTIAAASEPWFGTDDNAGATQNTEDIYHLGGNVGIGTATPTAQLEVADQALIDGITVGQGGGDVATNTVVGAGALPVNTTGSNNIAIGPLAGSDITTGSRNVLIGDNAGAGSNITQSINIGSQAGMNNTQSGLIAMGADAAMNNTRLDVLAIGNNAMINNNGVSNMGIGREALQNAAVGNGSNVAIGNQAQQNAPGSENVSVGHQSLQGTAGVNSFQNVALGVRALQTAAGPGWRNVAIGFEAMSAGGGREQIAIGYRALRNNTSSSASVAIGNSALAATTTGGANVGIGRVSLSQLITGIGNTAVGQNTGFTLGGASSNNTFIGYRSGENTSATSVLNQNTAVGALTGFRFTAGANGNVLLGYSTGQFLTSGARNLLLGYSIEAPSNTGSNQMSIGNLIFGTGVDGTGTTISSGNIGIGTNAPTEKLEVDGNIYASGAGNALLTDISVYPDYVFENYVDGTSALNSDYSLKTLKEVEAYIQQHKHLPGVTGIKELKKTEEGQYVMNVSELSGQLLEKVEELFIHTIEQQKELNDKKQHITILETENKKKDHKIKELEERLSKIESLLKASSPK